MSANFKLNEKVQASLTHILSRFESGDLPASIAYATFPAPPSCPSSKWSLLNRTIQACHGTNDARGYKQWLEVGRHVKKGEHAYIFILVPFFRKSSVSSGGAVSRSTGKKASTPSLPSLSSTASSTASSSDDSTGGLYLSGFGASAVFAYDQTEGEPLPEYEITLPDLPLLDRAKDWGIEVKGMPGGGYYGFFDFRKNQISLATPEESTFFHELSHAAHHRILKAKNGGAGLSGGQVPLQEITAELAAQTISRIVGKRADETIGRSYDYIRYYAQKAKMDVNQAIMRVLSDVDKILKEILGPVLVDDNNAEAVR